jgi:hypothetical protein
MKDYLADLARRSPSPAQARSEVREYLQARTLGALQRAGAMIPLAFQGGTALRFLYGIPRYSEDLDFALERARDDYDIRRWLRMLQNELSDEGYEPAIKLNDRKTVHSAFVRFPGLLFELGLSAQATETLAVKVEVDTQPPAGAGLQTTVIRRHVILRLQHHDRPSLFAGKLHAVLSRPYAKGRDIFDLLWYVSDPQNPPPNLTLLNNALRQTGWTGPVLNGQNWRQTVAERLQALDWQRVAGDVRPFIEPPFDMSLLNRETVLQALKSAGR